LLLGAQLAICSASEMCLHEWAASESDERKLANASDFTVHRYMHADPPFPSPPPSPTPHTTPHSAAPPLPPPPHPPSHILSPPPLPFFNYTHHFNVAIPGAYSRTQSCRQARKAANKTCG
jgi:hypothetical protein